MIKLLNYVDSIKLLMLIKYNCYILAYAKLQKNLTKDNITRCVTVIEMSREERNDQYGRPSVSKSNINATV